MSPDQDDLADLVYAELHGKIGNMTMPGIEDDAPRLSELVRIMTDFRAEFRHAMETVVRKDVYAAERAAAELQIVSLKQEIARLDREIIARHAELKSELVTHGTDHKNYATRMAGAWITAGLSLLVGIVLALVK